MASVIIGDYQYEVKSGYVANATVVDKTKTEYESPLAEVTIDGTRYEVGWLNRTFQDCKALVEAPVLPSKAYYFNRTFYGCTSLKRAVIQPTTSSISSQASFEYTFSGCTSLEEFEFPTGAKGAYGVFNGCTSLADAPTLPVGITNISNAFRDCTSLIGNVEVNSTPTIYDNAFRGTVNEIFIVNRGSGETEWKTIASQYSNVHYEADDNPAPVISNFTATRVSAVGATTFDATGLYAYVQARLMIYDTIPDGWTNELKSIVLNDNGVVESPTWQPAITDYPADVHCWIYLGDTSTHNLSLQITDSVKEDNVEVKSQSSNEAITTVSKSYALVDYYHDDVTDTEGMAIGKYAEQADLLDVDMPTRLRQGMTSDGDVTVNGDVLLELDTAEPPDTTTTDGQIYQALKDLSWDSDVIV